jgi:hypothetical protein
VKSGETSELTVQPATRQPCRRQPSYHIRPCSYPAWRRRCSPGRGRRHGVTRPERHGRARWMPRWRGEEGSGSMWRRRGRWHIAKTEGQRGGSRLSIAEAPAGASPARPRCSTCPVWAIFFFGLPPQIILARNINTKQV